jgi:hypothetical protein
MSLARADRYGCFRFPLLNHRFTYGHEWSFAGPGAIILQTLRVSTSHLKRFCNRYPFPECCSPCRITVGEANYSVQFLTEQKTQIAMLDILAISWVPECRVRKIV